MASDYNGEPTGDWTIACLEALALMLEAIVTRDEPGGKARAALLMRFARRQLMDALSDQQVDDAIVPTRN